MMAELRKEVGRLVVETTAKVTGKVLTMDDQKRLANLLTDHLNEMFQQGNLSGEGLRQLQDRLRWLMGAEDLRQAREKSKEFTLAGRADKIECPLLVGYSIDDRVMDPRGALRLYENSVNSSERSMVDGVGHGQKRFDRRSYIADWFMKQLKE